MTELAAALRAEVEAAAEQFAGWGEADVTRDRGAGKWVKKEILGHLIDSAANNHQRFVRAQAVDPFVWPGYDQNAWVALHGYRARPWRELVDLWVALNLQVAHVIATVPPERLQTRCRIGDKEETPLEWWMNDYLRHLRHHLAQLAE
jgi:hypothetical protein